MFSSPELTRVDMDKVDFTAIDKHDLYRESDGFSFGLTLLRAMGVDPSLYNLLINSLIKIYFKTILISMD